MENNKLRIDLNSTVKFDKEKSYGDVMSLEDFLDSCDSGCFIDYDGFMREIIIHGKVVSDEMIYPSDALEMKTKLIQLQNEEGPIEIVWYNR